MIKKAELVEYMKLQETQIDILKLEVKIAQELDSLNKQTKTVLKGFLAGLENQGEYHINLIKSDLKLENNRDYHNAFINLKLKIDLNYYYKDDSESEVNKIIYKTIQVCDKEELEHFIDYYLLTELRYDQEIFIEGEEK